MTRRRRPAAGGTTAAPRHEVPPPTVARRSAAALVVPALVLLVAALLHAVVHSNSLADTWISLAGGRHVAAQGPGDADPFSYASRPAAAAQLPADADAGTRLRAWLHPTGWINQNWLSHLVLHLVVRLGGENALLAWKAVVYAAVAALLVVAGRRHGAGAAASVLAAAAALEVARPLLEIRAQDHTNLVVAGLMVLMQVAATGDQRWWWGVPPLLAVWCNLHGGFVFGFIALAAYLGTGWLGRGRPSLGGGLATPVLKAGVTAAALAVVTSVAASPYRLANLTHLLEVTLGADASEWRGVGEWAPVWRIAAGDALPFVALATAWGVALVVVTFAGGRGRHRPGHAVAAGPDGGLAAGPLDLPAAAVAAVAVALALLSHRFVPIAAIIVAPQAAALLHRLAALRAPRRGAGTHRRGAMAPALAWTLAAAGALAVALPLVRLLAAPWPADDVRTSPLARLAHLHLRPAGACAFLTANRVEGRIWNFWEEGGYLAFCQEPTAAGGIPVLVTIDGRAQGAYPVSAFRRYLELRDGGPLGRSALAAGRLLTAAERREVLDWTRGQLAGLGVGLADIHEAQRHLTVSLVLQDLPQWQPVYADNEHTLLADTTSAAGEALTRRAAQGTIVFPDEFSRCLTGALRLRNSRSEADLLRLVALARQAHRLRPSARAVELAAAALPLAASRDQALAFLDEVVADFFAQRDRYRERDGYAGRVAAAQAALVLQRAAAGPEGGTLVARRLADLAAERAQLDRDVLF